MLFSKNEKAEKIGKNIEDVQKQLEDVRTQLGTKETDAEEAIAQGESEKADKLLGEVGLLKLKESATKKALAKMETEQGIVATRERRAKKLAEIAKGGKEAKKILDELAVETPGLSKMALKFYEAINKFNIKADSLGPNADGLNGNLLLRIFGDASDGGHNLAANVAAAAADLDRQLDTTRTYVNDRIKKLKDAVDEELAAKAAAELEAKAAAVLAVAAAKAAAELEAKAAAVLAVAAAKAEAEAGPQKQPEYLTQEEHDEEWIRKAGSVYEQRQRREVLVKHKAKIAKYKELHGIKSDEQPENVFAERDAEDDSKSRADKYLD